jgi:hypothetical protein
MIFNNEMFGSSKSLISIVTGNEANEFKWSVNKLWYFNSGNLKIIR